MQANERMFQDQVMQIARMNGWQVFHASPHLVRPGVWRSDGQGFPDLLMAHPTRGCIAAELKSDTGKLSPAQVVWRNALVPHMEWVLWRPKDLNAIAKRLGANKC
jgi:hypothetical protein